jgi:hypothetical protein
VRILVTLPHWSGMKTLFLTLALLSGSFALFAGPLTMSHSEGKFSDAEIEATIKAKLAKSKIGKDGFQVHVKERVATWTGSTTIMQHKGAATRMAKAAGALRVVNNIKVSDDTAPSSKSGPNAPRHVQVKTAPPSTDEPWWRMPINFHPKRGTVLDPMKPSLTCVSFDRLDRLMLYGRHAAPQLKPDDLRAVLQCVAHALQLHLDCAPAITLI